MMMALSKYINAMQRIGDATPIFLREGLQTVDTTGASDGLLGHSDFAGTALDDFRGIIWLSLAPEKRCVLTTEAGQEAWWRFGGDCPPPEFREASEVARMAGGPAEALAAVDAELPTASPERKSTLERLKARLKAWLDR